MAQGSWKSGSVAHYGSTTDTPASLLPGKRLGEPVVARSTVPQTEADAVYPQDPPSSYIVQDPAGSARLHAPEPEGKGTMHGCTVGTTPHGLSQIGSIHFFPLVLGVWFPPPLSTEPDLPPTGIDPILTPLSRAPSSFSSSAANKEASFSQSLTIATISCIFG